MQDKKSKSLGLAFNIFVVKQSKFLPQESLLNVKIKASLNYTSEPEVAKRMRVLSMRACNTYRLTNRIGMLSLFAIMHAMRTFCKRRESEITVCVGGGGGALLSKHVHVTNCTDRGTHFSHSSVNLFSRHVVDVGNKFCGHLPFFLLPPEDGESALSRNIKNYPQLPVPFQNHVASSRKSLTHCVYP